MSDSQQKQAKRPIEEVYDDSEDSDDLPVVASQEEEDVDEDIEADEEDEDSMADEAVEEDEDDDTYDEEADLEELREENIKLKADLAYLAKSLREAQKALGDAAAI
jgi:hypothetical protein